jgi:hypothetical protein
MRRRPTRADRRSGRPREMVATRVANACMRPRHARPSRRRSSFRRHRFYSCVSFDRAWARASHRRCPARPPGRCSPRVRRRCGGALLLRWHRLALASPRVLTQHILTHALPHERWRRSRGGPRSPSCSMRRSQTRVDVPFSAGAELENPSRAVRRPAPRRQTRSVFHADFERNQHGQLAAWRAAGLELTLAGAGQRFDHGLPGALIGEGAHADPSAGRRGAWGRLATV